MLTAVSPLTRTSYPHLARPEMLPFVPATAQRVLDVGCNTGAFGESLKRERPGLTVWGVEPDPASAERARMLLDHVEQGLFGPTLPLPPQHFDAIIFNDVLEHMVDPWAALQQCREWLAPGGVVVVSLPNLLHQGTLWPLLHERDFRYEATGVRDRTHLRFFTRRSAHRLFDEAGYEVLRCEGINENWWTPSLRRRLLYRLFAKPLEETKYVQFAFVARPL